MSSPIFLSNEQLNALFNQRDSVVEESKQNLTKPQKTVSNIPAKKIKSSLFEVEHVSTSKPEEVINSPQIHETEGQVAQKNEKISQIIQISQDEYYQLKAEIEISKDQVIQIKKEMNIMEERIIFKNKETRDLKDQNKKLSQVESDSGEVNVLKQKNQMLQDQNQRLTIQTKELLNKNKELVEEVQQHYDSMLKAKLDQQDSKLKMLALQKDQRKTQNKYESQFGRLEKNIQMLKQQSDVPVRRESQTATNSHSSAEEQEKVQSTAIESDKISPPHQWKSNIVYGTQGQSNTNLVLQKVLIGNGAFVAQNISGKPMKDPFSPKKQVA